jgi:hypothetical protein
MVLTIKLAILAGVSGVPVLLALACKAIESRSLDPSNGQRSGNRVLLTIYALVSLWGLWGLWAICHLGKVTPWLGVFGIAGLLFCCFFNMTLSLQEWLESRANGRKKIPRSTPFKGSLWDAELDQ